VFPIFGSVLEADVAEFRFDVVVGAVVNGPKLRSLNMALLFVIGCCCCCPDGLLAFVVVGNIRLFILLVGAFF
jgi:hypothetical protein